MRTDIAAFVGYAERGPLPEDYAPGFDPGLVAVRLTSWAEFQARFGGFLPNGALAYAVRAFFANGGDTCYVVRVAASRPLPAGVAPDRQPVAASLPLPSGAAKPIGALAAAPAGFAVQLKLDATVPPDAPVGQLATFGGTGLSRTAVVVARLADGSYLLSEALPPGFAAGDPVTLWPTAAVVSARSRGFWGNRLKLEFTALDAGAFGLRVTLDLGPGTLPTEQEFYRRLTPTTAAAVLQAESNLISWTGSGTVLFEDAGPLGRRVAWLAGGRDGLADVRLADFSGSGDDRRGLRLLEEIDEVAILAIPDAVLTVTPPLLAPAPVPPPCTPPPPDPAPVLPPDPTGVPAALSPDDRLTLQTLMIEQCERLNYRVALIDPPAGLQPQQMSQWPAAQGLVNQSARFAALYYPWLSVPDPLGPTGASRLVPPSGHVAGAYAQTDLTLGVQHPPANVPLASVTDVAQRLSDLDNGLLNPQSVNAIRAFPGRGIRVWGARSLSTEPAWRFIHVRRLVSAIEETVQRCTRWAVFEVNNKALRQTLTHSVTVLLEGLWAKGGLLGSKAADGFYVKCDDTNNPQSVIDVGEVICEVGVAVAAPMEFIVFQIRQDVAGGNVVER